MSRDDSCMTTADFEEKTYEIAYCIELATGVGGHPAVFSPGQVLEKLLGFDAAANPGSGHVLWKVLAHPRPAGVVLAPPLWGLLKTLQPKTSSIPSYPVSLFLQFKRPEHVHGPTAKQWKLWKHAYYRFKRTTHQQQTLARLERRLGAQAAVRYAAPAFHTIAQFESAQLAGTVIAQSGHVPPARLRKHVWWTYDSPGTYGRANPNGNRYLFEPFAFVVDVALAGVRTSRELEVYRGDDDAARLRNHLSALAQACRGREPALRSSVDAWVSQLDSLQLEPPVVESLRDYASIQSLMSRDNMSWWLLAG